jgi:hypothetical protein
MSELRAEIDKLWKLQTSGIRVHEKTAYTAEMSYEELLNDNPWPEEFVFTLPTGWSGNVVIQFENDDQYPYEVRLYENAPGYYYSWPKGATNTSDPAYIYPSPSDRQLTLSLAVWPERNQNPYLGSEPSILMPVFHFHGTAEQGSAIIFERIKTAFPDPRNNHISLRVATVKFTFTK